MNRGKMVGRIILGSRVLRTAGRVPEPMQLVSDDDRQLRD